MIALQSRTHRRRARPAGFSLVELLMVVGIIAVLIALLLPTLGKARSKARQTTCASQLAQIYKAGLTWQVDAEKQTPPAPLQATGWRTMFAPYVTDLRIYNCPETPAGAEGAAAAANDKAGTPKSPGGTTPGVPSGGGGAGGSASGTGTSGGSSTTDGTKNTPPSLADAYVEIDPHNGKVWDVPAKEGPWFQKKNAKAGYYELWLEDQGFAGGGDKDFKDVAIAVQDNGDGNVTLSVIPIQKGLPSYDSYVKAPGADGQPKTLFGGPNGMYKSGGTQPGGPGSSTVLSGPFDPNDPTSGSHSSTDGGTTGGVGGTGGTSGGGGGPAVVGTDGGGEPSDYGLSAYVRQINGNSDKVFGMDYTFSVIDPTKDDWSKAPFTLSGSARPVFARHMGYANILYGDGSVRPAPVSATQFNPVDSTNAKAYWNPK